MRPGQNPSDPLAANHDPLPNLPLPCGLAFNGRFFVELCSTVNISRSGCCLRLRTRPQTDSALVLRAVPGGTLFPAGASQLLFQLAWMRPHDGGWLIGAFALGEADLYRLAFPSYTP